METLLGLTFMYIKNKKYTACVLGCGRAGFSYDLDPNRKEIYSHIGMYRSSNKISKLIAVDKNKKTLDKVKNLYPEIICYDNFNDALMQEKIDILSISTPTNLRYPVFQDALYNNIKTIFCEKPISNNIEEAKKIIKLLRKNNSKCAVNYFRRWDKFHIDIANFIKEDKLGTIKNISFKYSNGIINTGSHAFDLIQMIFGKIKSVESKRSLNDNIKDPTLDVIVELASGPSVYMHGFNKKDFRIFELDVIGTQGRIIIHNGYEMEYYVVEKSKRNSEFNVLEKKHPLFKNGRSFHYENTLMNIFDSIESNKKILCNEINALSALSCSLGSIESYRNNKKIVF
jgi:predicted dehydrogenase